MTDRIRPADCEHPKLVPAFDAVAAETMTSTEVRRAFPRGSGICPDCGENMAAVYASFEHYVKGDW